VSKRQGPTGPTHTLQDGAAIDDRCSGLSDLVQLKRVGDVL